MSAYRLANLLHQITAVSCRSWAGSDTSTPNTYARPELSDRRTTDTHHEPPSACIAKITRRDSGHIHALIIRNVQAAPPLF